MEITGNFILNYGSHIEMLMGRDFSFNEMMIHYTAVNAH